MISSIVGSRFRKNILLMSLLVSLSLAVVYYIAGLISGLLATSGMIPPWAGAWAAFVIFVVLTLIGFRYART
jgi:lipopolysaccharide export system permease protein